MTNQTAKRGRPRKTEPKAAQEVAVKPNASAKREKAIKDYYEKTPRHYESINYRGVVYMLKSTDVPIFDEEKGSVVTLRYCQGETSDIQRRAGPSI